MDLMASGLEIIVSRKQTWQLKVQGVLLTLTAASISVRDALVKAGIDPNKGWTAALKIKGAPRETIGLDGIIDLSRPGIEKLWLRPNHINNGEAPCGPCRDFAIPQADAQFLEKRELVWDSVMEGASRWIIFRKYPMPEGYTMSEADIAVQIPATYPQAALDMFYCYPLCNLPAAVKSLRQRSGKRYKEDPTSAGPAIAAETQLGIPTAIVSSRTSPSLTKPLFARSSRDDRPDSCYGRS